MKGVIQQRAIDIFQSPSACGIVLVRTRCQADIAAVYVGSQSKDVPNLTFTKTGNLSDFDSALGYTNGVMPPSAQAWVADPQGTWLQTAGTIYVLATGENDILHQPIYDVKVDDLAQHALAAGPYAPLIPAAYASRKPQPGGQTPTGTKLRRMSLSLDDAQTLAALLVPKLGALFPIGSDPTLDLSPTVSGSARVGVAMATVNELFDSPPVLMEPQSRAFLRSVVDFEIDHGATVEGLDRAHFDNAVESVQSPANFRALHAVEEALASSYLRTLDASAKSAALFGLFTAQGAYNAAVLHDTSLDIEARNLIEKSPGVDASLPEIAAARQAFLANSTPAAWNEENALLTNLTLAIVSAK